jgi:hypothetical protein
VGPPVELKWAHQPTNLSHPTSSSSAAAPRERQKQKQKQRRGKKKEIVNFLKRHAKSSHEDVQRDKNVTTPTQTPTPTPAPATPLSLEVELDEAPAATMQDGVTVVSCDGLYEHVLNVDLLCLCPVTRCMFTSGPFAEALRGRVLFQTIPGAALKECVRFLYALKTNTLNQHSIAGYKARLTDLLRAAHFLQLLPLLHKTAAALAEQSEAYMEELMVLPRALLCVVLKYCNAGHLHLVSLRLPPSPFPSSRPRGCVSLHDACIYIYIYMCVCVCLATPYYVILICLCIIAHTQQQQTAPQALLLPHRHRRAVAGNARAQHQTRPNSSRLSSFFSSFFFS